MCPHEQRCHSSPLGGESERDITDRQQKADGRKQTAEIRKQKGDNGKQKAKSGKQTADGRYETQKVILALPPPTTRQ
jgi:hypothetical protein